MLAARLYGPHDLRLEDIEPPRPPEGWALIKSLAVGICGTDKAFYTGTYPLLKRPLVLGHEVVGKVVEGPEGLIDKLVVSEINFSCMKCSFCRMGLYTHCPHRKTLGIDFDGGMAEYFIAPLTSLHIVEGMDPIMAVEVEPLAAVLNMLEQAPPSPQSKVAVIGSGNLAILILQILRNMNIETVAIVRGDSPKRRYIESLDIETICTDKVEDYVAERTPEGMGFDMVIEA
ncbi:MAG: zinc-binding dehydrogenase, partial [Thermoprotei archaeon]